MGLLREPEMKKLLKEAVDEMLGQMRSAISDAVRANMPPMPQPNTAQIARLTVVVEGLKRDIQTIVAGKEIATGKLPTGVDPYPINKEPKVKSAPITAREIREIVEEEKANKEVEQKVAEAKDAEKSAEDAAKIPEEQPEPKSDLENTIPPDVAGQEVAQEEVPSVPTPEQVAALSKIVPAMRGTSKAAKKTSKPKAKKTKAKETVVS